MPLTSFHILSRVSRSAVCMSMPRGGELLHLLDPRPELVGRRPQRDLRVDVEVTGDVDDREQEVAELVRDRLVARARGRGVGELAASSTILGSVAETSGQSKPTLAALLWIASAYASPGSARDAVEHRRRAALLGALDLLPVATAPRRHRRRTVDAFDVAEHVRMAADELVVHAASTSAIVNRPSCSAIVAWNSIW